MVERHDGVALFRAGRRLGAVGIIAAMALTFTGSARAQTAETPPVAAPSTRAAALEPLVARPGGLPADRAAARARATSYDVKARRSEASAASSGVTQAALGFLPRLTAKGSYMRLSDVGTQSLGNVVVAPQGTPVGPVGAGTTLTSVPLGFTFPNDNYALEADLLIPVSDYLLRLADQYGSAKHAVHAAEYTARAAELAAARDARVLYYGWARSKLALAVAEAALALARDHLADAQARFAAVQSSRADVLQVESLLAERELSVERAKNAVVAASDRLRTTLHEEAGAPYEIGEPLLADLPPVPGEGDFAALVDEAMRTRWELRAVRENTEALRAQAGAARASLYPRLDAVGSAVYANPNPRYFPPPGDWRATWAVGGSISWSSADAVLGGASGAATEARADAAAAQETALREGLRAEVMHAYEGLHDADAALLATARSLTAAEESYRVRRSLFRAGAATSTELTDAESALTRARFESLNARIDVRVARAELDHATGRDAAR